MEQKLNNIVSIKELAYENLKSRIISGELKPGQRLLEAEISQELGVSRAPIREALNMLDRDGFAQIYPRKGAVVSEITEADIFNIWEMRLVIEPYAAKASLQKITDSEIALVDQTVQYVTDHQEDFERYMNSDLMIHDLLAKHLDNSLMKATLENIRAHSLRIRWIDEYSENGARKPETPIAVNKEHMEIIAALKSREEDKVYNAVLHHLLRSTDRIVEAAHLSVTDEQKKRLEYFKVAP